MRAFSHWLLALAFASAAPLAAQETRMGEEGFEAAPASIEQFDWLIGQWAGEGIGGAPAMESWLSPLGGTMVGTFVQETEAGEIMFSEHMYLVKDGASISLKLKHFNADLTGWEAKDDMLTFRLIAIEPCAAYFNALTLRCDGDSGLVAAVRMKSDAPEPQELLFRFTNAAKIAMSEPGSCNEGHTTIEINKCVSNVLASADDQRKRYFDAAIKEVEDTDDSFRKSVGASSNRSISEQMQASRAAFEAHRDVECGAVYDKWSGGSIRGLMGLTCRIKMTDQRTHDIWRNWLTFMDSRVPVLPKPELTR